ncbi:MAG: hypothetical protein ACK5QS_11525 [Pseudanabaenaceae cyanobacterium]
MNPNNNKHSQSSNSDTNNQPEVIYYQEEPILPQKEPKFRDPITKKLLIAGAITLAVLGGGGYFAFQKFNKTPARANFSLNNDTVKPTSPVVTEQESAANQLANARREATSSGNLEKAIQMAQGIPNSSSVYIEAQQQIQSWKSDFEKYNSVLANIRQAYNAGQWQVVVDLSYNQIPRNQYWDSNSELTSMAVDAKQKLQSSRKVVTAKVESLETFRHSSGVFSIEVPKSWQGQDNSKPGQEVTVQWTDPPGNALISVTLINAPKESVSKEKLGRVLQQVLKNILGHQRDFMMEPPQSQPDGSIQVTFSYTESSRGVTAKVQGNSFIEQKEDKILILTFGSLADKFNELKESYTRVANSIKVSTNKIP